MFLTGFADEAGRELATQIAATQELKWKNIESRALNAGTLATISDEEFEVVFEQLSTAGISVNCYGSAIANWAKHPRKAEDFEASKQELLAVIPRLQRLGTKLVRGMSFLVPQDEEPDSPELEAIIFDKVRELVNICADNGLVYGHENCMNYGGMSYVHTLKLLEKMNSPAFTLIYDTGNPVFNLRRIGAKPYVRQSSWEFYTQVREFISYVHIKDATAVVGADGQVTTQYCFAGNGEGDVRAIVIDLLKHGYDGGFSMEPHLATIFHEKDSESDDITRKQRQMETYIEYGRRFEKLLSECLLDAIL